MLTTSAQTTPFLDKFMRYLGTLVEWNDQRGFGFIQADAGGERVFVHISALTPKPSAQSRPQVGLRLEFAMRVEGGKPRAHKVAWRKLAGTAQHPAAARSGGHAPRRATGRSSYFAILVFVLIFLAVGTVWGIPSWVASLYGVLSLITFFAYWKDKVAAQAGRWRTPESTLHALALLGGWPGAIVAQQWLRHKSSKSGFQVVFCLTVLLNVAALVWLHSPWAGEWLSRLRT